MISPALLLIGGIATLFVGLLAGLVAVSALDNEARGISKSLAVVQAFSAAPRVMQEELDLPFRDRVVNPLLDRFIAIGRRLTPADYSDRLREKLELAGNPPHWTPERIVGAKSIGLFTLAIVAAALALLMQLSLTTAVLAILCAAAAGYFAPNLYLHNVAEKRSQTMRKTFPDAIDLLTISVEAGLGFDAALSHVAKNTEGPLADEFARVLQEMQIGLGRSQALRALGERTSLEEMRAFTSAMVQADAFGVPIGQVLRVQSSEIRTKRRQRAEEQAQKLPVKILFPLMFFILPCLFLVVMGPAAITMMDLFSQM